MWLRVFLTIVLVIFMMILSPIIAYFLLSGANNTFIIYTIVCLICGAVAAIPVLIWLRHSKYKKAWVILASIGIVLLCAVLIMLPQVKIGKHI